MMRAATKAAPAASPVSLRPSSSRLLQRKCACADHDGSSQCEECSENKLQRKAAGGSDPKQAPAIVDKVLRAPGAPLDEQARGFMVYVSNDAMGRSLAHEIGHILLNPGPHRTDVTNIMATTNSSPLGETIDDGQCNTIYRNA